MNIKEQVRCTGMEAEEENETLERLTYLIVEKVGPNVLISYNLLRDKLRAKFLYYDLRDLAKDDENS
jgi:hypothetical protein